MNVFQISKCILIIPSYLNFKHSTIMLFSMCLYKSVSSFKMFDPLIEDLSKKGGYLISF